MSTLRVQSVGAPGAGTTTNVLEGVAKHWDLIVVTSGVPAIGDSSGLSSVVDGGVGRYLPNLTPMMKVGNRYAIIASCDSGAVAVATNGQDQCLLQCLSNTGANNDPAAAHFLTLGDLA